MKNSVISSLVIFFDPRCARAKKKSPGRKTLFFALVTKLLLQQVFSFTDLRPKTCFYTPPVTTFTTLPATLGLSLRIKITSTCKKVSQN
jgi:hypothetical protein